MKGVTLIELLLVVAIMAAILASSYPLGSGFLDRNSLNNKASEVVNSLRIAQLNAISGKEESEWGVNITADNIILFKGSSYSTRDPIYDETYDVPARISINPVPTEIVFNRLSGNPASSVSLSISNQSGNTTAISVNEVGIVDVN